MTEPFGCSPVAVATTLSGLTVREREVLSPTAEGLRNAVIGARASVQPRECVVARHEVVELELDSRAMAAVDQPRDHGDGGQAGHDVPAVVDRLVLDAPTVD